MNKENLFGMETNVAVRGYVALLKNAILLRYGIDPKERIPLGFKPSSLFPDLDIIQKGEGQAIDKGVVVGTVRMGYGHHRMAFSLYSWILANKGKPFLHDLLAIDSKEATAIKEIDGLYSQMSRVSSEWGGITEWLWGQITAAGNINSLLLSLGLAENYTNMMDTINRDLPYISTYPLNGQIAVASGFKKVIHLIPDNYPQYYLLVPEALNLVQSPASYLKFIEMGIPKENLLIAGHWVSHAISSNINRDSEYRIARIEQKKPVRIVLPIGGAGAQKGYTLKLLGLLKDKVKSGEIFLFINTGDHKTIFEAIKEELEKLTLDYRVVSDWKGLLDFCRENDFSNPETPKNAPITLFNYENYYEAFTTTDYLIRVSDILASKPSELAFYPVPKLFIRRVGDHEAASAFRSMELGEGTTECREPEHAIEMIKLLTEQSAILLRMNECVIRNERDGIYDGAKKAVEIAMNS